MGGNGLIDHGRVIALIGRGEKGRGGGGAAGAARIAAAPGRLGSGVKKKKRKGRGEADRWGPLVSERKTKEKEKGRCGLARGEGRWATGPER
jgi:hypothetical protein